MLIACSCALSLASFSQTYITRNGYIGFFSKTPMEDIQAENKQVYAVVDLGTKNIAFTALLKGFLFKKELMQEHFNENYVESDKYPKTTFAGTIKTTEDLTKPGIHKVEISGTLTLHNVSKPFTTSATIETQEGKIIGKSHFTLTPQEYNIQIPALVKDKIAKVINVDVLIECTPKK
jgi:polyisoprenoid-binding protein YceI